MKISVAAIRGGALAALILTFLGLGASSAFAHDELTGSDPAAGSTVDELPGELVLRYSGDLIDQAGATEVLVLGPAGEDLRAGDAVVDGRIVTQELTGEATGTVTVTWKVVSSDGHPISETFVFGVGEAPGDPHVVETSEPTADEAAGFPTATVIMVGAIVVIAALGIGAVTPITRRRGPTAGPDAESEGSRED